jgi:hypothetical protein
MAQPGTPLWFGPLAGIAAISNAVMPHLTQPECPPSNGRDEHVEVRHGQD